MIMTTVEEDSVNEAGVLDKIGGNRARQVNESTQAWA